MSFGPQIRTGSWTPTLTAAANVAATSAKLCLFYEIGNVINFSGQFTVQPSSAALCRVGITLPVSSNFASQEDLSGPAGCRNLQGQAGALNADITNDRMEFACVMVTAANGEWSFTGSYLKI